MAYFPLPQADSESKLVDEQTRRLLAIRQASQQQESGFAQAIGGGFGQGLSQGVEAGIHDNELKKTLAMLHQQGRLKVDPETAFHMVKSGMKPPQTVDQTPLQSAQTRLASDRANALEHPTPKAPKKSEQYSEDNLVHKLDKDFSSMTDVLNSPRGRLLGSLGQNRIRELRASLAIKDPKMVSQTLHNIQNDIAGIFQGGAPTIEGMKGNEYDNINLTITKILSFTTSHPAAINSPAVKDSINGVLRDLRKVSSGILRQNLEMHMKADEYFQKRYPGHKKYAKQIYDGLMKNPIYSGDLSDLEPASQSKVHKYDDVINSTLGKP